MKEINRFLATVEVLRRGVAKGIPTQQVVLFLTVVEQPGITMPELCRRLDMPQGSLSRNVKALSSFTEQIRGRAVRKGHDLLCTEPDPVNRHCLAVYATPRGEAIAGQMARLLRGGPGKMSPRDRALDRSAGQREVSSGGCVAAGDYQHTNGDRFITSR